MVGLCQTFSGGWSSSAPESSAKSCMAGGGTYAWRGDRLSPSTETLFSLERNPLDLGCTRTSVTQSGLSQPSVAHRGAPTWCSPAQCPSPVCPTSSVSLNLCPSPVSPTMGSSSLYTPSRCPPLCCLPASGLILLSQLSVPQPACPALLSQPGVSRVSSHRSILVSLIPVPPIPVSPISVPVGAESAGRSAVSQRPLAALRGTALPGPLQTPTPAQDPAPGAPPSWNPR